MEAMAAIPGSGGSFSFLPHELRDQILAEIHARPLFPVRLECRILCFAFLTDTRAAARDRAALSAFCVERGASGPAAGAKHRRISLGDSILRWEQHSEFTTYTFEFGGGDSSPFERSAAELASVMQALPQPGPHLVSIDLQLAPDVPTECLAALFDPASLAAASVMGGQALAATDFKVTHDGFVRILVSGRALTPDSAGALTQRLLEIETYRTFALLGLPEAQRLAPSVKRIEDALSGIAREMTQSEGLEANHRLLNTLTQLAAEQEAEATASGYRFSASRAYDGIVHQRLEVLKEVPVESWPTFSAFLARRMGPAMRTCEMMETRQANLAERLSRTANLLRTRVYVDMEEQNRDLMKTMNERTRLQLRLQQTVEGLSVAAVSYYVIGLLGYMFKGAKEGGLLPFDPAVATAATLPLVIFLVWRAVRRIRKTHREGD